MKKVLLLLFAVCFSFLFCACGDEAEKTTKSEYEQILDTRIDYSPDGSFYQDTKQKEPSNFIETLGYYWTVFIRYAAYILVVFLLVVIVYVVVRQVSVSHNMKNEKNKEEVDINSNSIFKHNYKKEIDLLVSKQDYKGAIRLLYLYTLHSMNENNAVKWSESKTPVEYYYELNRPALKHVFFRVTSAFLGVVYGDTQADAELFSQVSEDAHAIVKCLTPVTK
ncbi:MAG: hypothetical protein IKP37_13800 [Paludibacteraceae bacterium]|nr:hypothetical protein [Paludibacteraceae bacterium]